MPTTYTPLLQITEMQASQAQPELIFNEAIRVLEAMNPLQVLDKDQTVPPSSPADGDRYIVPSNATGDWSDKAFQVALNINGDWKYLTPTPGWLAYVADEGVWYEFIAGSPSGWAHFTGYP